MKKHLSQAAVAAKTFNNASADAYRPADELLRSLEARIDGLDEAQIPQRLARDGFNEVSLREAAALVAAAAACVQEPVHHRAAGAGRWCSCSPMPATSPGRDHRR